MILTITAVKVIPTERWYLIDGRRHTYDVIVSVGDRFFKRTEPNETCAAALARTVRDFGTINTSKWTCILIDRW